MQLLTWALTPETTSGVLGLPMRMNLEHLRARPGEDLDLRPGVLGTNTCFPCEGSFRRTGWLAQLRPTLEAFLSNLMFGE